MHDLTEDVAAAVAHSNIKTGVVNIFNVGSTAAVGTIEFEPGLEKDLPAILNKLIPPSRYYGHEQAMRSLRLFAEEVIPAFRPVAGEAVA